MIHIGKSDLTIRDKILVSLIARFLANKLDPSIKSEITGEEISTILDTDKAVIFARLKDLTDIKAITRLEKGTYEIMPFYIERLLDEIDSKYNSGKNELKTESTAQKETKKNVTKSSKNIPKIGIKDDFLDKIINIDKSKYTYINNIPTVNLKTLAVLDMCRKELNVEWISSPQIIKVLQEKFRIRVTWPSVSIALKELDQKAFVQSRKREGHSTAREYRIMKYGEDQLQIAMQKLKEKNEYPF